LTAKDVNAHVSIVSVWEIAIKSSLGKLELTSSLEELVRSFPEFHLHLLPLRTEHVLLLHALPHHHRDPFDRILNAQAKHEGMHLLTADPQFSAYDVPLIKT
jgi:PIN domain nuclease of toxin-antitoxin system